MLDVLRHEPVDVSSLRALMVSGSPLSPDRLAEAVERLGPVVYQGYGQTEAGNIAMLTPRDIAAGPDRVLARSAGRTRAWRSACATRAGASRPRARPARSTCAARTR